MTDLALLARFRGELIGRASTQLRHAMTNLLDAGCTMDGPRAAELHALRRVILAAWDLYRYGGDRARLAFCAEADLFLLKQREAHEAER